MKSKYKTITRDQAHALCVVEDLITAMRNNPDAYWESEGRDSEKVSRLLCYELNEILYKHDLPTVDFSVDISSVPFFEDYYIMLTEEEQKDWENRASDGNGAQEWADNSGAYEEYDKAYSAILEDLETYMEQFKHSEVEEYY